MNQDQRSLLDWVLWPFGVLLMLIVVGLAWLDHIFIRPFCGPPNRARLKHLQNGTQVFVLEEGYRADGFWREGTYFLSVTPIGCRISSGAQFHHIPSIDEAKATIARLIEHSKKPIRIL